jgi:hypothetical protein
MRIITFIEDQEAIKTILQHLGLRKFRSRPPAKAHAPPALSAVEGARDLIPRNTPVCGDPIYPWEAYI